MASDPKSPIRADHRFIKNLMTSILGGKVEHVPSEFDMVSRVFGRVGGSWAAIFNGDPANIDLLKRILRRAFKMGRLTKKNSWGSG